jgi:hypothetical protein
MKNYTRNIFLLVIVVGALFLIFKSKINNEQTPSTDTSNTTQKIATSGAKANIKSVVGFSIPDKAWTTWENYLEYARVHDIAGVKSIAYIFNGTCSKVEADPGMQEKCYKILDDLYSLGITLKRSDFPNVSFDNKQVIFFTNVSQKEEANTMGTAKNLIYFINKGDEIKLLYLEMWRSFAIEKKNLTSEQIASKIEEKTKDTDGDGLEDQLESCPNRAPEICTKTDPLKKDSDGDGYWDSIEPLLK